MFLWDSSGQIWISRINGNHNIGDWSFPLNNDRERRQQCTTLSPSKKNKLKITKRIYINKDVQIKNENIQLPVAFSPGMPMQCITVSILLPFLWYKKKRFFSISLTSIFNDNIFAFPFYFIFVSLCFLILCIHNHKIIKRFSQ